MHVCMSTVICLCFFYVFLVGGVELQSVFQVLKMMVVCFFCDVQA